jgi:hypothetical protein
MPAPHSLLARMGLSIALIEYLGGTRAERPQGLPCAPSDSAAEKAARLLWEQLMTHPLPD